MLTFEEFRDKLADAVTVAVNTGTTISDVGTGLREDNFNCPLGCLTGTRYPLSADRFRPIGLALEWAWDFIAGFDRGEEWGDTESKALGRAYRRKFVTGAK